MRRSASTVPRVARSRNNARGVDRAAPGDRSAESRRDVGPQRGADARPDSVGADQGRGRIVVAGLGWSAGDANPVGFVADIDEGAAEPKLDVGMFRDFGRQRRLQRGAVNHPVGSIGISRQRQAGNFDAARAAHHPHRVRHDRGCRKRRMQAEADENARCVGRELQAGACFLKHGRLFENDDAAAGRGQRQRGGQPSDPGTGDDDGRASCRHGNVRRPCRSPRIPAGGPHPARDR